MRATEIGVGEHPRRMPNEIPPERPASTPPAYTACFLFIPKYVICDDLCCNVRSAFKFGAYYTNIKSKSSIKYLGITIDQCLKWLPHLTTLKNRVRKLSYIFSILRYVMNEKLLRMTYFAFCQSIIQYGIIGWGGAYKAHTQSLYIAQKLIIKII